MEAAALAAGKQRNAPELNPDEGVWVDAKGRPANARPDDLDARYRRLYATLRALKQSPGRLRRCVRQGELSLFV